MKYHWTDEELRALEDPACWEGGEQWEGTPQPDRVTVLAVKFPRAELRLVAAAATRAGMSVFDFVRTAAVTQAQATETAAAQQVQ